MIPPDTGCVVPLPALNGEVELPAVLVAPGAALGRGAAEAPWFGLAMAPLFSPGPPPPKLGFNPLGLNPLLSPALLPVLKPELLFPGPAPLPRLPGPPEVGPAAVLPPNNPPVFTFATKTFDPVTLPS